MLQIAIWGICLMLIVKGLDVMHRQALADARHDGKKGGMLPMVFACVVAFGGALLLFAMASEQVSRTPTMPNFGTP
jgi:hypothetical protein